MHTRIHIRMKVRYTPSCTWFNNKTCIMHVLFNIACTLIFLCMCTYVSLIFDCTCTTVVSTDYQESFKVHVDANDYEQIQYYILQESEKTDHPISYFLQKLNQHKHLCSSTR